MKKKDIKAVRVELHTPLYEKLKKYLRDDYKTPTAFIRDYIVRYVKDREQEE